MNIVSQINYYNTGIHPSILMLISYYNTGMHPSIVMLISYLKARYGLGMICVGLVGPLPLGEFSSIYCGMTLAVLGCKQGEALAPHFNANQ